jgi:hypothetical protein
MNKERSDWLFDLPAKMKRERVMRVHWRRKQGQNMPAIKTSEIRWLWSRTKLRIMSRTSSIGDSAELERNLTLSDRLKVFKNSHFDPNAFVTSKCQTMNEKVSSYSSCFMFLCMYLQAMSSLGNRMWRILMIALLVKYVGNKAPVFIPCGPEKGFCRGNEKKCLC